MGKIDVVNRRFSCRSTAKLVVTNIDVFASRRQNHSFLWNAAKSLIPLGIPAQCDRVTQRIMRDHDACIMCASGGSTTGVGVGHWGVPALLYTRTHTDQVF